MDSNDTAMFISMSIPLLVFIANEVRNKWGRYGLYAAAVLAVPGVILTGSRGGMLTMAVAVALTVWRKTKWWKAAITGAVVSVAVLAIIPSQTEQRYQTIKSYQEAPSAVTRIRAWETSLAMAADRSVTGVGFGQDVYMREYNNYSVVPEDHPRAAHSVWFSLIGETGYVGLALYVSMLVSVLLITRRIMKRATRRGSKRKKWAWNYAAGLQCALLTFAIGGTFLSQARFEFIFALCMVAVPLAHIAEGELKAAAPETRKTKKMAGASVIIGRPVPKR